jgi:hypothetical protein
MRFSGFSECAVSTMLIDCPLNSFTSQLQYIALRFIGGLHRGAWSLFRRFYPDLFLHNPELLSVHTLKDFKDIRLCISRLQVLFCPGIEMSDLFTLMGNLGDFKAVDIFT